MSFMCCDCMNKNSFKCLNCGTAQNGDREYFELKPQTNADYIRQMTDEELADFLCHWDECGSTEGLGYNTEKVGNYWLCTAPGGGDIGGECQVCAMAWLKSPVEVDGCD